MYLAEVYQVTIPGITMNKKKVSTFKISPPRMKINK